VTESYDVGEIISGLYGDGIIGLKGAFSRSWARRMRGEVMALYEEAARIPDGTLPRGPNRFYVEIPPERISGFVDIAVHPWFVAVCEAVLGRDYRIVEIGFDVPFPGAADQPWHRDFKSPQATLEGRRLNSLAFNLTAVDTIAEMGAFEIAPGTQWDDLSDCPGEMFPPREAWPRYEARKVGKLPQMGDIAARSALAIHRGTANVSDRPRPVLVIGADAPDATNAAHHDLQATPAWLASVPARVRDHLTCRVTDVLEPVIQHHQIEGLLKPAY
jgi:hypothetical protein